MSLWWLFHITSLFWKVIFPFHARILNKVKYIHITCVIIGILIPLLPVIASMANFAVNLQKQSENSTSKLQFISGGLGFRSNRFPPLLCTGTSRDATFYSLILPLDIILASGCTMLLIIFWSVHKLSRRSRSQVCFKINKV